MLIEKVFSIPGIGKLAVDAMSNRDLPQLQGTVVYIALVFVAVSYTHLDVYKRQELKDRYILMLPEFRERQ